MSSNSLKPKFKRGHNLITFLILTLSSPSTTRALILKSRLAQPIGCQLPVTGSSVMKTLNRRLPQFGSDASIHRLKMLKAVGQVLFSTGLQSPKFTAVEGNKAEDYEVRTYHATKWMSTSLSGMHLDAAMKDGFRRLFSYIQGNNLKKVKVEMTAPVTGRVDPGAGPACESQFTVSFYIPEEHQENPPEPSDPLVFVEHREEFTAYVRKYGGFSNENMKREELLKLLESLQRDGVPFVDKPYYTVGYDSPFKLTNRRNEVWVLKKEEQH